MARPRNFIETEVIDSAAEAFAARGYAGTTLDELARVPGRVERLGGPSLLCRFDHRLVMGGSKHEMA